MKDNFLWKENSCPQFMGQHFCVKRLSHKINIIIIRYIYKNFKTANWPPKEHLAWFLAFISKV